eukprot:CAMPEP_0194156846 /NCGR_PEP_ID=MMETSP0152-20130528/69763_1 /TAXON_ID=1049557 /ORGANISM="Thalassiothrix antarctica, Strain L6-D1" /LENGTH=550 /DNA_ID=CAMNT_0038864817 /DNA_START=423 /DNA_END=2075 /DNA_ORIENTATION=+
MSAFLLTLYIEEIQTYDLFDSITLAIGGVRETKECWKIIVRSSTYAYAIITVVGVYFYAKIVMEIISTVHIDQFDQYITTKEEITALRVSVFLFSAGEALSFNVSIIQITFSIISFILFFMFKKNNMNKKDKNFQLGENISIRALFKFVSQNLQQFKMEERNNQIQTMNLYWAILLAFLGILNILDTLFFIHRPSSLFPSSRFMISFLPTLILFLVLLENINEVEKLQVESQERTFRRNARRCLNLEITTSDRIVRGDNLIYDLNETKWTPSWLYWIFVANANKEGFNQADIQPERWTITIRDFIRFFDACMATDSWTTLAREKGEENITMHDVSGEFIKPWSCGTGRSISLLFDPNPGKVELMISHSWSGSARETVNAVKTLITMHSLPEDTRLFFCPLSQYQAEDGASGGLSIQQQLDRKPFTQVLNSYPKYGMYVIHTSISEVYNRLWCVHEVHEASKKNIKITGLFDPKAWTLPTFDRLMKIKTENAECSMKSDKEMLKETIDSGEGFAQLDKVVHNFRKRAKRDLIKATAYQRTFGLDISTFESI